LQPRFRRTLFGLALLIYVAGVALLAFWLPYRPAAVIPWTAESREFLVGFSPDGTRLAVGPRVLHHSVMDENGNLPLPDDSFHQWRVTGEHPVQLAIPADIDPHILVHYAIDPTARHLAWNYIDDPIWKPAIGHRGPRNWGWSRLSPDEQFALSPQNDLTTDIIDWRSGKRLFKIPVTSGEFVFCDNTIVAASMLSDWRAANRRVQISRWDLISGRNLSSTDLSCQIEIEDIPSYPAGSHLSPNGRWLTEERGPHYPDTSPTTGVILWDAWSGHQRLTVPFVRHCAFTRHGQTLVTIHNNDEAKGTPRLRLFDLDSGATSSFLPSRADPDGDFFLLPSIAVSPDGNLIAAADHQGYGSSLQNWPKVTAWLESIGIPLQGYSSEAVLIDAEHLRELARLPHGPEFCYPEVHDMEPQMTFSPDGRRLAVLGADAIRIWDLPPRRSWGSIFSLPLIPALPTALMGLWRRRTRELLAK
jgi:WD40 repeat protein